MKLEQGKFCPLIGKDCIGIQCSWFTQIRGINPQTGEEVDEWECAVKMMPILLIENSQMQRQTGAAIETARDQEGFGGQVVQIVEEVQVKGEEQADQEEVVQDQLMIIKLV